MKAPHFWYQKSSSFLVFFLKKISKIVILAARLRQKTAHPTILPIPVICCGNVTVGGSGKTPLSLELSQILQKKGLNPHFLTRGYGRKRTRLPKKTLKIDSVNFPTDHFEFFGDEALLLGRSAPCWIDANRKRSAVLAYKAGAGCLIMDDGFQSPSLHKDLNLLLFNGAHGLGNSNILPAGPLREPLADAIQRADYAIIVGEDRFNLLEILQKNGLRVAKISLAPSKNFLKPFLSQPVCAFAGIAFPEDFFAMLSQYGLQLKKTYSFPDHHLYTKADIQNLLEIAKKYPLLTTVKDAVKFPEHIRKIFVIVEITVTWHSQAQQDEIFQILFQNYKARLKQ